MTDTRIQNLRINVQKMILIGIICIIVVVLSILSPNFLTVRNFTNVFLQMSVAARNREQRVAFLSGGNQQKIVISKCLNREGDILLMDEPTRGVDVGAKREIHDIIRSLANEGKGIIVFSSELPEIEHLCDRIVLMHEGTAREIVPNGKDLDSDYIMTVVAGGEA